MGDVVIFYRKIEGPNFAASSGRLLLVSRRLLTDLGHHLKSSEWPVKFCDIFYDAASNKIKGSGQGP